VEPQQKKEVADVKELHVIAPNQPGVLAGISEALGRNHINIESLAAEAMGDSGVIRLITRNASKAKQVLEKLGYNVMDSDILVLRLQDRPGELARVSSLLGERGINIENVYLLSKEAGASVLAVRVDNHEAAKQLLKPYVKE